jgi:RHS repeat-associated protein
VENRRIGKSVNGTQSWFGYDGQNSYADFNGSGSLAMRYLEGKDLDELYARFDGTNTGWYLNDMLGSVRQIANTSGTVLDTMTYDSYGQILSESNSSNGDRFKHTSREWDSEIGQYYHRARNYSASDGRFTNQDPLGFGGADSDLYRYVRNRPQQFQDSTVEYMAVIEGLRDDYGGRGTGGGGPNRPVTAMGSEPSARSPPSLQPLSGPWSYVAISAPPSGGQVPPTFTASGVVVGDAVQTGVIAYVRNNATSHLSYAVTTVTPGTTPGTGQWSAKFSGLDPGGYQLFVKAVTNFANSDQEPIIVVGPAGGAPHAKEGKGDD